MSRVMEVLAQRQEWEHHPACPACGFIGPMNLRFTLARTIRDGSGRMSMDVTTLGESDPHLVVQCPVCSAEWEMECRS